MCGIRNENYPKSKEWELKALAMPNIPRGKSYPNSLKTILQAIKKQKPYNSIINIEGSSRKESLDEICVRLRPINFVSGNSKTEWKLTNEALIWLEIEDDLYLAALLNANIKFFSEILYILSQGKCQIQNLLRIAVNDYEIPWKTKNEILARLNWLKDLNLIEYEDYSYNYVITELGKKFLKNIGYIDHSCIKKEFDQTINEFEIQISDWALELCKIKGNDKRRAGIGYFPGKVDNMHNTLMEYLKLMHKPTNKYIRHHRIFQ